MVMRGGTSKGAYFVRDDLPSDPHDRDQLLLRIMGTPDPRQIDGIGGAHPLTSKVAVVGPDREGRGDIEYMFLQLGVDEPTVTDRQYCGNILAGVGPFAVERGLVPVDGDRVTVNIHMLNFDSYATATFPVTDGCPVYSGDQHISGVPGTGAPIRLDFQGLAGSTTGSLLPSGHAVDELEGVECTLVDNGMPVVVIRASDVGVTGYESCAELEANEQLRGHLEAIRRSAAGPMNLGDVAEASVPKMTLVAPPRRGGNISTRTFIPHRCHQAIGVLGAVSVATAALIPGSTAAGSMEPTTQGTVTLEHPTGLFETIIEVGIGDGGSPVVNRAGIVRTARKLMDGTVYPRSYD
jgi:4-oxalomesaconate tautomerase